MNALLKAYGIARSALIYRANPLKRRRSRRFYGQFVGPGDLAFDIGAHLGDRVQAWTDLGARVVAVEPQSAPDGGAAAALRGSPDVAWSGSGRGGGRERRSC